MSAREHDLDLIRDHIHDHGHTQDTDEQGCPYCAVNRIESALKSETQRADEAEALAEVWRDKASAQWDRWHETNAKLAAAKRERDRWEWVARELADRGASCGFTLDDAFVEYAAAHPEAGS